MACLGLLLIGVARAQPAAQQPANLPTLLERAARYADAFVAGFSNVIAEERYVQEVTAPPNVTVPSGNPPGVTIVRDSPQRRDSFKTEFVLVRATAPDRWVSFHDVFEWNGHQTRTRDERLTKVLAPPSLEHLDRAVTLVSNSARDIGYAIANPALPIAFLEARHQSLFSFELGARDTHAGADVWIVNFQTRELSPFPDWSVSCCLSARGRVWIEAGTGRVVKAEVSTAPSKSVVTTFRFDDALQLAVPVEMHEEYPYGADPTLFGNPVGFSGAWFTGTATYGRFRRFGSISSASQ
jgi:hypothetical protein